MVFSSPNVCHIGVFECVFERAKRPAYPFCAGSPTALRLVLDKRWAVQGIQKLPESIRPKLVICSAHHTTTRPARLALVTDNLPPMLGVWVQVPPHKGLGVHGGSCAAA